MDRLVDGGIDPERMMPGTGCCALSDSVRLTEHAVRPAAIHHLYANWRSGDADKLQQGLNDIRMTFQAFPMIPALKAAAGHWSGDARWDVVRPPLVALTAGQKTALLAEPERRNFDMPGLGNVTSLSPSYQTAISRTHRSFQGVQSPRRLSSHKLGRAVALARLQ